MALNRVPWLQASFGALARRRNTSRIAGGFFDDGEQLYNALYFFVRRAAPGDLSKRHSCRSPNTCLSPGRSRWIPGRETSRIFSGRGAASFVAAACASGPIICWESAFSNLDVADVRDGAQALVIATDDAWFGTTGGPYQHAQIAQMRAIETGRWIVRAAATGVSGIIAPDGRYLRAKDSAKPASCRARSDGRSTPYSTTWAAPRWRFFWPPSW